MEKIPNWLRYILAIPFGYICCILGYYIMYLSNLWIASPDSLMVLFNKFLYSNCLIIVVFVYTMNMMLPKYQIQFSLVLTILYSSLGLVGLGMMIITGTLTFLYIIQLLLAVITCIILNYYVFQEYKIENTVNIIQEKNDFDYKKEMVLELCERSGLSFEICSIIYDIGNLFNNNRDLAYTHITQYLIPQIKKEGLIGKAGIAFGMLVDENGITQEESIEYTKKVINEVINNEN